MCGSSGTTVVSPPSAEGRGLQRDRSFKQLCVGAHDWMPIHVVPPSKVVQFLQAKRRDGYAVVGLEQTSRSQSIEHVKFPDKVLAGCKEARLGTGAQADNSMWCDVVVHETNRWLWCLERKRKAFPWR